MEQEDYLVSDTNRVENLVDDIIAKGQPDDMFLELMSILETTELLPQVGRYYTFIYQPKTPELRYDQFPLIACIGVYPWGFKGINYHWGDYRNYTWDEVGNNDLHLVYPMELEDMRSIPYQQFNYT
tara:strand:+ start:8652 stop:9029 length:378 start_codon:yes stop_codon:yes gene_type:complete